MISSQKNKKNIYIYRHAWPEGRIEKGRHGGVSKRHESRGEAKRNESIEPQTNTTAKTTDKQNDTDTPTIRH